MLALGENQRGDAGAKDLAAVLANNTALTALYLEGNDIGDAGAKELAAALANNTTLTMLDLSANNIDVGRCRCRRHRHCDDKNHFAGSYFPRCERHDLRWNAALGLCAGNQHVPHVRFMEIGIEELDVLVERNAKGSQRCTGTSPLVFFSESTIRVVFDTVSPHSEDPPAQALPPHKIVDAAQSLRLHPQLHQLQYAGVDLCETTTWQACIDAVSDVENCHLRSITFISGITLKAGEINKKKK